jgi:hypothetical protein
VDGVSLVHIVFVTSLTKPLSAPPWYSTYRFYLSIIVGFSIIGTLAGTGYYGVGSGALAGPGEKDVTTAKLTSMQRLDRVAAKNHKSVSGVKTGRVGGEVETESLGEDGDAFVKFVNKSKVSRGALDMSSTTDVLSERGRS